MSVGLLNTLFMTESKMNIFNKELFKTVNMLECSGRSLVINKSAKIARY